MTVGSKQPNNVPPTAANPPNAAMTQANTEAWTQYW